MHLENKELKNMRIHTAQTELLIWVHQTLQEIDFTLLRSTASASGKEKIQKVDKHSQGSQAMLKEPY